MSNNSIKVNPEKIGEAVQDYEVLRKMLEGWLAECREIMPEKKQPSGFFSNLWWLFTSSDNEPSVTDYLSKERSKFYNEFFHKTWGVRRLRDIADTDPDEVYLQDSESISCLAYLETIDVKEMQKL